MPFRLIWGFLSYTGICWFPVTHRISLVCLLDAGDDWQWVNGNKILGFKLWPLKWFLHRPGLMWTRFSEMVWPLSLCFFPTCLSCSVSLVFRLLLRFFFCLFPASSPSLRCTRESRCRHVVFITRSLPAGPGLAVIGWLMRMSQLNMQRIPSSSLSHQEIKSVTAKRIFSSTYGQIIHVHRNMQAGTHMHSHAPGKVWCFSVFFCCFNPSCRLRNYKIMDHLTLSDTILISRHYYRNK